MIFKKKAFIMEKENGGEFKENGTKENGIQVRLLVKANTFPKKRVIIEGSFQTI